MDISGQYRIAMPRAAVWDALMDPQVLKRCVPGCRSLERTGPNEYEAEIALTIGPVKASFDAELGLEELQPPESYRLKGSGRGGPVGFGQGYADVVLAEAEGDATVLKYTADFQVGGRLAQLGSRLVLGTTRKLADEFFDKLTSDLDAHAQRVGAPAVQQAAPSRGHRLLVLASVAVVVLALLAWWLLGPGTAA